MNRNLTLLSAFLLAITSNAQTVLFEEDFEGVPAFTLNTTDLGSLAASTTNKWVVNNVYLGGLFGLIPNTPAQPAGISSANGNYLHTLSDFAEMAGVFNSNFLAPGDGPAFARMSADVSTVGQSDVTLKFWWLCQGGPTNYGEVHYSTDGGTTWQPIVTASPASGQYRAQGSWTQQTIALPAFNEQPALRFGFRFVNVGETGVSDPGFSVDDVLITAGGAAPATVELGTVPAAPLCQGAGLNVPYTAQGSFDAGNVFTAQLSDAGGSFAAPVGIGSVASTTSGIIACTIPPGTVPGTGYRVRVVSSAPALTTADNGTGITIDAPYSAGTNGTLAVCAGTGTYALFDELGGSPAACGTWTGPGGGAFNGIFDSSTGTPGVYTYGTAACGGACPGATATVTVTLTEQFSAGTDGTLAVCTGSGVHDLFAQLGGAPVGCGTWTGPGGGASDGTFDSDSDVPGVYTYSTAACGGGCDPASATVTVTLSTGGDAGTDVAQAFCTDAPPADLGALMNGDPGGTFTYQGQSTLPDLTEPGVYVLEYEVGGVGDCGLSTAALTITVVQAPHAGSSASVQICDDDDPTALFNFLGDAEAGGTWQTPAGLPFNGIFDPAVHSDGVYIYTVAGTPPCSDASAAVAVVIDPCVGVPELGALPDVRWAGQDADGAHVFTVGAHGAHMWEVLDITGRAVATGSAMVHEGRARVRLEAATGVHLVRFGTGGAGRVLRIVHVAQ